MLRDSKSGEPRPHLLPPGPYALRHEIAERALSGADRNFTIPCDTVYDEHKRACKLAGIHDHTIRDHRHTAAVSLCRAGMPLNMVQQQLGHRSLKMTERYAEFNVDYSDAAPYLDRVAATYSLAPSDTPGDTPAEAKEEANA